MRPMLLDALSAPAPLRSDMTHKAISRLLPDTTDVFVQSYGAVDGTTMDLNFQLTSRQQRAVVSFMEQFFSAVEGSGKTLSVFSKPDLKKMGILVIPSFSAMKAELSKATNCQISSLHKTFTTAVQILGKMAKVRAAQSCDRMLACVNYAMHYSKLALEYESTRREPSQMSQMSQMSIEEVLELALCESHMSSERLAELGLDSARKWKMGLNKKYELKRCDKLIREAAAAIHIVAAYGVPACFISFASELLMNIRQANVGTTCSVLRKRSVAKILKTRKAFATSHKALLLLPAYSQFVDVGKISYNNSTIHLLDVLFRHMFPDCEKFPAYIPTDGLEASTTNEFDEVESEIILHCEPTNAPALPTTTTITTAPDVLTTIKITTAPATTITPAVAKGKKRPHSPSPSDKEEEGFGQNQYKKIQSPAKKMKNVDVVVSGAKISDYDEEDDDDFYLDDDENNEFAEYDSDPYN